MMLGLKHLLLLCWSFRISIGICVDNSDESQITECICPDTDPQPIVSTECSYWCTESTSISYEIIDRQKGLVNISLLPSPQQCHHNQMEIDLYVAEDKTCDKTDESDFIRHSQRSVTLCRDNSTCQTCSKSIVLDFDYIFTGCYRLIILPSQVISESEKTSSQSCHSNPMYIETDYVKRLIDDPTVSISNDLSSRRLVAVWNVTPPYRLETVDVFLLNLSPNYSDPTDVTEGTNCTLESSSNDTAENTHCMCEWLSSLREMVLRCVFKLEKAGRYRFSIIGYDTRCVPETLWADTLCKWHTEYVFTPSNISTTTTLPPDEHALVLYWTTIAFAVCLSLVSLIVLYVFYFKWRLPNPHRLYNRVTSYQSKPLSSYLINQKIDILLLYPRDCKPFMDAMEAFRELLRSIPNFQVFDHHDPDLYEEVAESTYTWGLERIADKSTKVVLAASWCSLKFHDSLITKKHRLVYPERLPFDHIFPHLLNELFMEELPYKKIFVVRLDCDRHEKLFFSHIAKSRNFTLPHRIDTLIHQIFDLPCEALIAMENEQREKVSKLETAIKKYSLYLKSNPDYLNKFLNYEPF